MRFRDNARLDTSQISDRRGGRGLVLGGGGGIVGLIVLVLTLLNGGDGTGTGPTAIDLGTGGGSSETVPDLAATCQTGADANQREECRIVGVVNSVQEFWTANLDGYREADTTFFTDAVSTACGQASSAVGPFYCPADSTVYIDLGFYRDLQTRFGARGGPFAQAYVIAHEYGHHVENLIGAFEGGDRSNEASVQIELLADCLAGAWANGAVEGQFIEELTDDDIRDGLDAAAAVGDDRIQEASGSEIDPEQFTHGSAAQRQDAFLQGYRGGTLDACADGSPTPHQGRIGS